MPVKRQPGKEVRIAPHFSALVLAAGAGRRFGGGKLTTPFQGGVLLDGALDAAFAAPVEEVVVVTGADPAVGSAARARARSAGQAARLRIVEAENWAEGLSTSLRSGMAAVPPGRSGVFLFLGDMPSVPHDLAGRLAERLQGDIVAVVPEVDGRPAHPALIAAALIPQVMALQGDRGARALLEAQGPRLVRLPVTAPGALFDVDTREALTV